VENHSLTKNSLSFPSFSIPKISLLIGLTFTGQWVLSDLAHIPGGGLGLLLGFGLIFYFLKPAKASFDSPSTVQGWVRRCHDVLENFEYLLEEGEQDKSKKERINSLQKIIDRNEDQNIGFLKTKGVKLPDKHQLEKVLGIKNQVKVSFPPALPVRDKNWILPDLIYEQDFIVYSLVLPMSAADLLWIKNIPADQPAWLMVASKDDIDWFDERKALEAQLPGRWTNRVLKWNGSQVEMVTVLSPIKKLLENPKKNTDITKQRLLSRLHSSWQQDLEKLRREKFKVIQAKSQWIVAGIVFASPVASTDLLAVAVVNGLMIKEMSKIWSCKMKPELIEAVSRQLAIAAIGQGVVEWTGQSLLSMAKLDGSTWVAAGTIQALSAAYLTRVVGRSIADWMALNNGVTKPDLELIKQQAPQLVSKAAELERVDWVAFLRQSKEWIQTQSINYKVKAV
tara:strand:- start:1099 stop:2454 length:1356 start_codon:yes stop_codon:yes gene_type:complete